MNYQNIWAGLCAGGLPVEPELQPVLAPGSAVEELVEPSVEDIFCEIHERGAI